MHIIQKLTVLPKSSWRYFVHTSVTSKLLSLSSRNISSFSCSHASSRFQQSVWEWWYQSHWFWTVLFWGAETQWDLQHWRRECGIPGIWLLCFPIKTRYRFCHLAFSNRKLFFSTFSIIHFTQLMLASVLHLTMYRYILLLTFSDYIYLHWPPTHAIPPP